MTTFFIIRDPMRAVSGDWRDPAEDVIDPDRTHFRFSVQGALYGTALIPMLNHLPDGTQAFYYGDVRDLSIFNTNITQRVYASGPYQWVTAIQEMTIVRQFRVRWPGQVFCSYWVYVENFFVQKFMNSALRKIPQVVEIRMTTGEVGTYMGGNSVRYTLLNLWCYHRPAIVQKCLVDLEHLGFNVDVFAFVQTAR